MPEVLDELMTLCEDESGFGVDRVQDLLRWRRRGERVGEREFVINERHEVQRRSVQDKRVSTG